MLSILVSDVAIFVLPPAWYVALWMMRSRLGGKLCRLRRFPTPELHLATSRSRPMELTGHVVSPTLGSRVR